MDLRVDELLPFCSKCDGTGTMENPALAESRRGGYGTHLVAATDVSCDECNGCGVSPTEAGKALIEFFQRAKSKRLIT